jgi:hypothetical protein
VGALAFDLNTNPMNPDLVALNTAYGPNYIHDCYVRNNKMYTADIYAGITRILDVTVKNNPVLLASMNTPSNFTHNSWLSDNSNVLFATDEVSGAYVIAFDISNLGNITPLDLFTGNPGTNSVPHNVHVKNDYLVIAHYRDGVVIADTHRPTNIIKIGNYDTYSQGSGSGFNGCWGVYPYLPSGNILASDMTNGLYVLGATYNRASYLEWSFCFNTQCTRSAGNYYFHYRCLCNRLGSSGNLQRSVFKSRLYNPHHFRSSYNCKCYYLKYSSWCCATATGMCRSRHIECHKHY